MDNILFMGRVPITVMGYRCERSLMQDTDVTAEHIGEHMDDVLAPPDPEPEPEPQPEEGQGE